MGESDDQRIKLLIEEIGRLTDLYKEANKHYTDTFYLLRESQNEVKELRKKLED